MCETGDSPLPRRDLYPQPPESVPALCQLSYKAFQLFRSGFRRGWPDATCEAPAPRDGRYSSIQWLGSNQQGVDDPGSVPTYSSA